MTVVALADIQPKRISGKHRNTEYILTYKPADRSWQWRVIYIQRVEYSGEAATSGAALRSAKRHIDKTLDAK